MSGHNIHQQIEELQRELAMRAGVYPKLVSSGKLRQVEANEHNARLKSAIATLEWCRDHRDLLADVQKRTAPEGGAA